MIEYSEALRTIEERARSREPGLGVEEVPLESARGRVLAGDLTSPEDVPAFNNSAMDGFALAAELTRGASASRPLSFPVGGSVSAGEWLNSPASDHENAIEIM